MLGDGRDPLGASSAGLGRVVDAALRARPQRLLVAVGGVASTDGGLGCLDELGWDLRGVDTTVATDVSTVFVDAAATFAPQKGADPAQVDVLTERLRHLAERFAAENRDIASLPGSGAAGGIAGGLAAVGAMLRPGSTLVAELVGLPVMVELADVVVTGEGRLDRTSLDGKVVGAVLELAAQRRCVVLAGQADESTARQLRAAGTVVQTLRELADSDAHAISDARPLLRRIAADVGQHLLHGA
jgi:glycerate kinase